MLPRRCKKCRCYVAPQLHRCPRCGKRAPVPVVATKPTKEEQHAARAKRDAHVPIVHAKHIHWIPSQLAINAHKAMVHELGRRLDKATTTRLRNTIRSELRAAKATLARTHVPSGKQGWTSELYHTKQMCVSVFISPKKHRYVLAESDGPADLIMMNRKNKKSMPFARLQRFDKSRFARMKKAEKQAEDVHQKRKKAKKAKRNKSPKS